MRQFKKKGFTLIELIVVIAIIGILAAILVPSLTGYIKKAKLAQANKAARTLNSACAAAVTEMDTHGSGVPGGDYNLIANSTYQNLGVTTDDGVDFTSFVKNYVGDTNKILSATIRITNEGQVKGVFVIMKGGYPGGSHGQCVIANMDSFDIEAACNG